MTDQRADEPGLTVSVTRTGGIAGLRREWRAEPAASDLPRWRALIDACPWDDIGVCTPRGADLFVWRIAVTAETVDRAVTLSEPEGPWRALIDEVRAAS